MPDWLFVLLIKPFISLFFLGLICLPARFISMKLPDGKLKRLLLRPVFKHLR